MACYRLYFIVLLSTSPLLPLYDLVCLTTAADLEQCPALSRYSLNNDCGGAETDNYSVQVQLYSSNKTTL